jgi:hypothetical protein
MNPSATARSSVPTEDQVLIAGGAVRAAPQAKAARMISRSTSANWRATQSARRSSA